MLHLPKDQIRSNLLNTHCEANEARLDCVFQKGTRVKKQHCSQSAAAPSILFWGHFCLAISQSAPEDLWQTMDQFWAWFSLTTGSIEFLIDICIKQNHCPASVKHPFFINTYRWSALPLTESLEALIPCVIWPSSSEWDTTEGEWGRGVEFIGFSKVRVGEREEKVLDQHNGLLFCWFRQYRRLSCQPSGDTIDLVMGLRGGYTPCCFNLLASSNLIW